MQTFLASIGTQECSVGTCPEINSSGCGGPMGIALVRESACSPGAGPTIWERYGVDADGHGLKYTDLADAIFTAAHILKAVLHAPPIGGAYAGYREAACGYYGACADSSANYAAEVMARAIRYGFHGSGASQPASAVFAAEGASCGGGSVGAGGASASQIVRIAQSQLGNGETPPGSNCNPYGPCEEWCALFVAWVWERAGVGLSGGTPPYAYSGSIYEWAKAHGASGASVLPPSARPAPGDAILFGTGPAAGESMHVGIGERVFANGEITTIDGNYGDSVARVGPFLPARAVAAGEPVPVYGYAAPGGSEAAPERAGAHG
jgi:hypothetical protein